MATQKQKAALIDKYNEAFIDIDNKIIREDYSRWFEKMITEASKVDKPNKERREALKDISINTRNFVRYAYTATVLSGITNVIENQRLDKEDKEKFAPILAILAIYGVRNVNLVKRKTELLTNHILGRRQELNNKDKIIIKQYRKYFDDNKAVINKTIKEAEQNIKRINKLVKSNITKSLQKNLKAQIKERVIDDTRGIKRPKTSNEIRESMRTTFGEQLDFRVRRVVDTELHELQEQAKQIQHLALGYTHKKWNTQQDARVRATHANINGDVVKIDKEFRIPGNSKSKCSSDTAMYPGDPSLSACQRINCRCFLTYVKRA